jgi:hypothetical protein
VIDPQELADAVACPARDVNSRCQDAGYCYPTICTHRLKALNLNQEEQTDVQYELPGL